MYKSQFSLFLMTSLSLTAGCSMVSGVSKASPKQFPAQPSTIFSPCEQTAESGFGYTVIRAGDGPKVADGVFTITYHGYVASTGLQYANLNKKQVATHDYTTKPAFTEAIYSLSVGDIKKFCFPPQLAYGDEKVGAIPVNSDLVEIFEVHTFTSAKEIDDSIKELRKQSN
ncbi:MAG: FKBP-type peptidyl-prolyl cis-trans isomerase [Parasphingorhabdus sp.]